MRIVYKFVTNVVLPQDAFDEACFLAKVAGTAVEFKINGRKIVASPLDNDEDLYAKHLASLKKSF